MTLLNFLNTKTTHTLAKDEAGAKRLWRIIFCRRTDFRSRHANLSITLTTHSSIDNISTILPATSLFCGYLSLLNATHTLSCFLMYRVINHILLKNFWLLQACIPVTDRKKSELHLGCIDWSLGHHFSARTCQLPIDGGCERSDAHPRHSTVWR